MSWERELEAAREIAIRAGEIGLRYQREGVKAEAKSDLSPVTAADRDAEQLIARSLEEAFPGDGLLGEEGSSRKSGTGRRWIIDPIDGTREYVRGNAAWAVMIGLEDGNEVRLGVIHFPALGETYTAVRGGGAWRNGERIRVSSVVEASQAVLCLNGFNEVMRFPFAPRLLEWIGRFWAVRSFGGCLDAAMVASGRADAWIEPGGKPWDFAAVKVIAEEAGAVFFNFDGRSTIYGGNCAICVPALEVELRRFVIGSEKKDHREAAPPLTREFDLGMTR